jgi:hypothetical protein
MTTQPEESGGKWGRSLATVIFLTTLLAVLAFFLQFIFPA